MKITTAIFDLDGTLLNTLGDLCDSVNCAMLRRGFPAVTEEQTRQRVGNGVRLLIEQCIPENKRTEAMIDICLDEFRTAYNERMMNRTQPYDGVLPLLKQLRKAGIAVGVLSNKYDLAAKGLIRHYFGDLVHITYGERPDVPRKPDPTSTHEIMDALGVQPGEILYIGDSDVDMRTARAAGATAVGALWGFRDKDSLLAAGAEHIVERPEDLIQLLDRLQLDAAMQAFEQNGFTWTFCATAAQAADYIAGQCAGKTVGFGGSMTIDRLGVYEMLQGKADLHWHWKGDSEITSGDVFLTSANAVSAMGETVNIDGRGNRIAASVYGFQSCYVVCGINKLAPDLPSAMRRAREIAGPMNAKRLNKRTPCAVDGKCHDCHSPERICRAMTILMAPPMGMQHYEIVLVGEELGY